MRKKRDSVQATFSSIKMTHFYSLFSNIIDWSNTIKKGIRFAILPESTSADIRLQSVERIFRARESLKCPEDSILIECTEKAGNGFVFSGVYSFKNYESNNWVKSLDVVKALNSEIDNFCEKPISIFFFGFEKFQTKAICSFFQKLRPLAKKPTKLVFVGPYQPELYSAYWRDHGLKGGSAPWSNYSAVVWRFSGPAIADVFESCDFKQVKSCQNLNQVICELSLLTNNDRELVEEALCLLETQEKPFSDLSIITREATGSGNLSDIVIERFEKLGEEQKEIFRSVYTNGFLSIKRDTVNWVDRSLVRADPLFLHSLANIDSEDDHHFLTPFSPLTQIIVRAIPSEFGIELPSYEVHYDANHSMAARLVNEIENFFRDQLRRIVNLAPTSDSADPIDAFLEIFESKEGFEAQFCTFIEDTGILNDQDRNKLLNAFRKAGIFSENGQDTYSTSASRIKCRSSARVDFVAEQLDLIYFLDASQWQTVFSEVGRKKVMKKLKTDSLIPKWDVASLFRKFTLLRNDVSHNRPVAQARVESLQDEFQNLQKEIGKTSSSTLEVS